jgi:arginine exporter protein ArgO
MALTIRKPYVLNTTNLGSPKVTANAAVDALNINNLKPQILTVIACAAINTNLVSPGVIDGITLSNGNLVLLKNQVSGIQNLIYKYDLGTDTLVQDEWATQQINNNNISLVYVLRGATLANQFFKLTNFNPSIGVDTLIFIGVDTTQTEANRIVQTGLADSVNGLIAGDFVALDVTGYMVKAVATSATLFRAQGVVIASALPGQAVLFVTRGYYTSPAYNFFTSDINRNLWVSAGVPGNYALNAPTTTGQYQYLLARVLSSSAIYLLTDSQTYTIA